MPGSFKGWRGDFQGFFLGLRMNNSKVYFDPNRDIRFAADKSPYKLNIYADARRGGYVALDAEGLVAAGGRYMMDAAQLARVRAGIAAERSGEDLAKIVAALRGKGYDVEGQELKRVPPPHPQDHP